MVNRADRQTFSIFLGSVDDVGAYLDVRTAAFTSEAPSVYTSTQVTDLLDRDETAGLLEMIEGDQLFVAKQDDLVVGLGGWRGRNVHNLYVDPSFMRQGIGASLLSKIEADFTARTGEKVLHVDAGLYTRAFYESCGYKFVAEVTSGDGLMYLEMRKVLR